MFLPFRAEEAIKVEYDPSKAADVARRIARMDGASRAVERSLLKEECQSGDG